jgi:tripartite-type tricarboxylate transporter receptor subunit TctC
MTHPAAEGRQGPDARGAGCHPPDVPTTAEVGLPDVVIYGCNAILAPAATPPADHRQAQCNRDQVLADADTIARGRTLELRLGGDPPEQFKQTMDKVTEIYAKVIKSANIKPD